MFPFPIFGRRRQKVTTQLEAINESLKSGDGEDGVEQQLDTVTVAELRRYRKTTMPKASIIASQLLARLASVPETEANLKKREIYARAIIALAPEIVFCDILSLGVSLAAASDENSRIDLDNESFNAKLTALKCLSCQPALNCFFSDKEQVEHYETFVNIANAIVKLDFGKMKPEIEGFLDHLLRTISILIRSQENWRLFLDVRQIVVWSDEFENIRSTISITHRQRHFVLSREEMDQLVGQFPQSSSRTDVASWKLQSAFEDKA